MSSNLLAKVCKEWAKSVVVIRPRREDKVAAGLQKIFIVEDIPLFSCHDTYRSLNLAFRINNLHGWLQDECLLWKPISARENHQALTHPFDLQVTQIKIQRGVSRDVNVVHYSLNPDVHISICIDGTTLVICDIWLEWYVFLEYMRSVIPMQKDLWLIPPLPCSYKKTVFLKDKGELLLFILV